MVKKLFKGVLYFSFVVLFFLLLVTRPVPAMAQATQGQHCDDNKTDATYPTCNTPLVCTLHQGLTFGICQNSETINKCTTSSHNLPNGAVCGCADDCQSGICEQLSGGAISISKFCKSPDPCGITSEKPDGCSCTGDSVCKSLHCTLDANGGGAVPGIQGACYTPPKDNSDTTATNSTTSNTAGICDSVTTGVIKIEYSYDPGVCWQANTSQRVKITCNDGSQKTQATQSGCYNNSDWVASAKIACANNTTCSTANIQAAACPASGIKLITPITSCATAGTYTSVSFICNDGYSQQLTNGVGICQTLSDFTNSVMPLCNNHKVCPTPTPTNTPTPTPTEAAATPIPKKSCDANGDGITNQDDLQPLEDQWFGQSTSKTADCNKDGVVNGLDFQMWRDIWILKQS